MSTPRPLRRLARRPWPSRWTLPSASTRRPLLSSRPPSSSLSCHGESADCRWPPGAPSSAS
eukprot:2276986-Alexandrium_andersonii.AAC.1